MIDDTFNFQRSAAQAIINIILIRCSILVAILFIYLFIYLFEMLVALCGASDFSTNRVILPIVSSFCNLMDSVP